MVSGHLTAEEYAVKGSLVAECMAVELAVIGTVTARVSPLLSNSPVA
jgi:hypothetical protein